MAPGGTAEHVADFHLRPVSESTFWTAIPSVMHDGPACDLVLIVHGT